MFGFTKFDITCLNFLNVFRDIFYGKQMVKFVNLVIQNFAFFINHDMIGLS